MLNMGKESKLQAKEIIRRAVKFFGPDGLGLAIVKQEECCARFEGGGGFVFVEIEGAKDKNTADVSVQGREWETKIREFMAKV